MLTKLKQNILRLEEIFESSSDPLYFHNKSLELLNIFSEREVITEIFITYFDQIVNNHSNSFMPTLTFFDNEKFQIRYNFFLKNEMLNVKQGSHLIHHHGNNILTSKLIHGEGYDSVIFNSSRDEKLVLLLPQEKISIKEKNPYTIKPFIYHLIFNVKKFSVTCNLWSKKDSEINDENRISYMFKDGVYHPVNEEDFLLRYSFVPEKYILLKCFLFWFKECNIDVDKLCRNNNTINNYLNDLNLRSINYLDEPKINSLDPTMGNIINYNDLFKT